MNVPEETVKAWMKIIDHHLRRYRKHLDYEEIVATGYYALAVQLRSDFWRETGGSVTAILRYVDWLVKNFLGSSSNRERTYTHAGKSVPECVSLADLEWRREEEGWKELCPRVPDFVPPLLDRLEVERRLARFKPRKRAALLLHCYHGMSYAEVARALSLSESQVKRDCAGVRVPGTMQRGGR